MIQPREEQMFSQRFQKSIRLTHHVMARMAKRDISLELIETGDIRHKTEFDLWIHKQYHGRSDNMVCTAVVIGQAVIVKTVMADWTLEEP